MGEPETGATPEQIEAAKRRACDELGERGDRYWGCIEDAAVYLVPPGHRIVGPDAVVLSAEEAALCRIACEETAEAYEGYALAGIDEDEALGADELAARYRALAAKLGPGS